MIKKYKSLSIPAKAAIWFTICSMIQKGISFITVPIFTRIMSTEDYGIYSIYNSWLQILTIISSLYLYYGVFNNAMVKYDDDRNRYISSMQGLNISITIIIFGLYLLFQKSLNDFFGLSTTLVVFMFVQMLINPAINYWLGKNRFDYKYKSVVLITIIQSILNPILGVILVYVFNNDVFGRISSIVITEIIFCLPILIIQFIKGRCFFSKKYWKYALKLAIPLLPHYLSSMVLNQGDRIMISKIVNNTAVAVYSIAYSIGMVAQVFTSSIVNSYTPTFYKNIKSKNYNENKKMINILLVFVAIVIIIMMLCAPELIAVFGTKEYASAVYAIPPVAASVFFIFLYNIVALPQFYHEKTSFLMCSSLIAALLNVFLNYIFISRFGFIAASYTTLLCYILYSFGHYIISSNIMKKKNINNMFDKKMIFTISLIVLLFNFLCTSIYKLIYVRYSLIVVIVIIFIINKKKIISFMKRIINKS